MNDTSDNVIVPYVMDEKNAALFIGVSQKTLQTWRSHRMGPPYIRITRKCIRYRKADLQDFIDSRVVKL